MTVLVGDKRGKWWTVISHLNVTKRYAPAVGCGTVGRDVSMSVVVPPPLSVRRVPLGLNDGFDGGNFWGAVDVFF